MPSARLPALMERLSELESDELDVVNAAIDEFSEVVSQKQFDTWTLGGQKLNVINK